MHTQHCGNDGEIRDGNGGFGLGRGAIDTKRQW